MSCNYGSYGKVSNPGVGWSNGDIAPQMFPVTHEGRLQLYGMNRRWIGLQHGWTRIGDEGSTELDARHSFSKGTGHSLVETEEHEAQTVRGGSVHALIVIESTHESHLCYHIFNY